MKRSNGDPARILGVAQDVTEEKALIQELEESREHFKSLIENLGDTTAMFRHALDGTLLYLSPSVEPMFGYKPEEGVGQKLQEAVEFSPESLARIMAGVQEMLATGKTVTIEVSFKHRDGSWRWNISHAHPVINSAGAIECIEVVAEDITRRKELELELAESEALLKEAQSLGKMGHWSLDLSTNRLYWSDELYRIHGYEPGSIDLTHELFLKMIHPDDAGWVAELVQSAAEKQETTKVEFRIVRPDGSIRYVRAINSYLERSESDLHIFGVTQDITEEKELAFDLEESHARYKGILDNLGDKTLVFQYAPDGTLLYLSPSCQYIYGITPEEAVGKHFRDVASLSEEVSSRLEHRNALAAEGDGTYTAELEYSHPDGSKRWVLSHAHGVKDEEGTLIFIEGIAEDVTERKLLEQTLKLNEERLSQALIGAGHGLWDVDLAENTIYMSPSWKAMLGYEDAELPNDLEIPFKLMHPDDVEYASNYLDIEYLSTLEKIDLEYRLQHKRGDYVRVHARGKIIKDERGTPIRLIGTHTNITERKMLETRLRVFERFAEESGQAFGIADLNTKVVYANPPMIELLGAKSLDELVGNSFVPYYSKDFIARLRSEIVPIIEEKGQWISENTFINAQGERIEVLEDFFIIKDENGEPRFYATVVTRIDEIKEKERYLEQAKEDAERANRTKSEFLANMSHELRTPLNAIHGMSHLAMESGVNPRQRYFMESIHAAAESLRDVIGNILDLSKVESGTIEIQNEEFLLEQPLEKALNFVALDAYKKGLSLVYEAERKLPGTVIGDERRVTEVLCNLLNNAVKYTEKGEIYLSVTGQEDSNDDTAVLSFSVTDTGAGIDPAAMDRLFQPFVQVDGSLTRKHAGAGIGLALSKQLVELMGGTIEVESTFGNGTTFTCTIPFMQPKQDHRTIANCIDYKLLTKRVLVISELSTERTALERTLGNIGIEVQSASSTEDAMQAIEGAAFDYWLIDLEWSNTNGFAIAEQLTAQSESDATLILLTPPYWNGTLYERAESAGFSSIIRKPLMYHTIQEGLLEVITKSTSEVRTADHDRFTLYKGMAGSGRILVVEDNSINQEVISEMLERLGFEFDIAENGKVALEHLDRTRYNLILMDIQMPVMDGYKTTKEIRTRHHISSIPIIALTAHALSEDRKRCLDAGMNDYMSKPVEPEELVRALQQWIPEHVPASSVDSLHKELDIDRDSEWIQILVQTGIDAPKALRLICGNAPFYTKMLRKFLQEYVPMPTQMILFVRDENFQDATHLAHTMKNMLGYLGAEHLWNETQDLEKHLKAKDPDSETHIRNYQVMIDSTAREVTKALAELEHETAVAP
ncbi:MAG: hypothetical protein CL946_11740 [Ectothiorhodospiraceae bacterium]|nr:hypothetical protein [Ectothiorhodospiraceae bacterium]